MNINIIRSDGYVETYLDTDASWKFETEVDALGHLLIYESKGSSKRLVIAYPPGEWGRLIATHHYAPPVN